MDFRPNIDAALWFAQRILPALADCHPHFWIVGRDPHPRLAPLRLLPAVTITGAVDDIRPYLAHADLVVAPLLAGGGTRLKLLEAMAMARPVVSTRLGADGYPVTDGIQLALADLAADFAAACRRLLADPSAAAALGRRGRAFVEKNYGWEQIVPRLEQLYGMVRREA
jgi:glycosyltransferase involved in cell wall biosynthesis